MYIGPSPLSDTGPRELEFVLIEAEELAALLFPCELLLQPPAATAADDGKAIGGVEGTGR